ncbi:MAG TPA: hypothetical protein VGS03_20270 [Candidatus Polarisedimenticolia bacterium]|jgi:hypothetical protein|nr:hypothetical protein [Candidatus Polarisedimenticolia bacterium]
MGMLVVLAALTHGTSARAQMCMNVNDCTGSSYAVKKDFGMADPTSAPSNAAGATTGGSCSASTTYRTYVAWCNESGCTAASPASADITPSSGSTNLITVTRPSIASGATSWSAYYSKSGTENHSILRICSGLGAGTGTLAAATTSESCKCAGNQLMTNSNQTGIVQMSKLDPSGPVKISSKDGTVQGKLTAERAVLDFATDLLPRFSPDAGANFRTVEWNSAAVYYVEPNFGAGTTNGVGRTVFSSITNALAAITDSAYTKPYVIKVRNNGGGELTGASITKPYVWLQGDGATRVGVIKILADGVRVSGLITPVIQVGNVTFPTYTPSDLDNVWITNNVVTNGAGSTGCGVNVNVGGGTRSHAVMVSNNRLGGSNDPGAIVDNKCALRNYAGNGGTGTVVQFVGNYVESDGCDYGNELLAAFGGTTDDTAKSIVLSSGNTLNCNVKDGLSAQGLNLACIGLGSNFGSLYSVSDACVIKRADSGSYAHDYVLAQTVGDYSGSISRNAEFINPRFSVNLPASHFSGDRIGYVWIDGPRVQLKMSNPRYQELAIGSGWSASDKYFANVSAFRSNPPSGTNTFLSWDNVVQAPDSDVILTSGATLSSITAAPSPRLLTDGFAAGLLLTGTDVGSTCDLNEMRFDTGGATKELCVCDPANTWNCASLGALQD